MVILLLKVCGGLYLHNRLHFQTAATVSSDLAAIGQPNFNCSCIDDFNVPFTETPEQVIHIPAAIKAEFVASRKFLTPFASEIFHSLRGPPSITA